MDERICNGSYFAMAFARFKEYLADPKKLEGPSANPVIREWARPGDYEKLKAKRDYKKALSAAKTLAPAEGKAAKAAAKAAKKAAFKEAKRLRRETKKCA
jgi:hypothetical protein